MRTPRCSRGHEQTGDNVYVRTNGTSYCRACKRMQDYNQRNFNGGFCASDIIACRPSDELIADRDMRLAMQPRDLTAAFLGDPLPGRSALDRRQSA